MAFLAAAGACRRLSFAPLVALGLACAAPSQAQITTVGTFAGTSNGADPFGSLTLSGAGTTFYGTTDAGGANGYGTLFSVPVGGGAITTLATFAGASNGSTPEEQPDADREHTLYGTTRYYRR